MYNRYNSPFYKRVPGLRDEATNSPVKVFNAAGDLIRIEPDGQPKPHFIRPNDLLSVRKLTRKTQG
jgi:hypothetical protein